jgi:hypothetical protein
MKDITFVAFICGGVAAFGVLYAGVTYNHEPAEPATTYTLVQNCRPPTFQRVKERVMRDDNGQLWFFDARDHKFKLNDEIEMRAVCKKI